MDAAASSAVVTVAEDPVWREDMVFSLCATLMVIGLYLDGWNHINLQNGALGSFFTPWHGVLYAGFTATALWLAWCNSHLWRKGVTARPQFHRYFGVPLRYPLAVLGVGVATVGMLGDAVWHTVFGEETGVARVIAPFHLVLFSGAVLVLGAPIRSGWYAEDVYPPHLTLRRFFPVLLSLTLVTASVAFMLQWLSAFIDWRPSLTLGKLPAALAADPTVEGTVEFAGVARVLATNVVLIAPVLLALRRWRLPAGSVTFMFTVAAAGMAVLTDYRSGWTVIAAVVGGVVADAMLHLQTVSIERPVSIRLFAAGTSAAIWITYFLTIRIAYDEVWPFDLWVGTTGVAMITSVLVSLLALPSSRTPAAWGGGTVAW